MKMVDVIVWLVVVDNSTFDPANGHFGTKQTISVRSHTAHESLPHIDGVRIGAMHYSNNAATQPARNHTATRFMRTQLLTCSTSAALVVSSTHTTDRSTCRQMRSDPPRTVHTSPHIHRMHGAWCMVVTTVVIRLRSVARSAGLRPTGLLLAACCHAGHHKTSAATLRISICWPHIHLCGVTEFPRSPCSPVSTDICCSSTPLPPLVL